MIALLFVALCYAIPYNALLCYAMLCYAIPYDAMLGQTMPRHAMPYPCHATSCQVTLCHVMLRVLINKMP